MNRVWQIGGDLGGRKPVKLNIVLLSLPSSLFPSPTDMFFCHLKQINNNCFPGVITKTNKGGPLRLEERKWSLAVCYVWTYKYIPEDIHCYISQHTFPISSNVKLKVLCCEVQYRIYLHSLPGYDETRQIFNKKAIFKAKRPRHKSIICLLTLLTIPYTVKCTFMVKVTFVQSVFC